MSKHDAGIQKHALTETIGERARNLYLAGQLLCSEAVLVVLNKGLGGGLPDEVAIRVASALPVGLGNSGCTCGALSGAVLAVGLFLGRSRPGSGDDMGALNAANLLHDRFKERYGATCCRVLTRNVKGDNKRHFEQCAELTAQAAAIAASIILERRPELTSSPEMTYLATRDSWLGARLRRWLNFFGGSRKERT